MTKIAGLVGLGIMGGALAANMVRRGIAVHGYDISADARERFSRLGGRVEASPAAVLAASGIVLTLLPSTAALDAAVSGPGGLIDATDPQRRIVLEMSTLPLEAKLEAQAALARVGTTLLDCPLSGTGAQAATGDLVVFGSGDPPAFEACRPILETMSRKQLHLGPFGAGSKFKFLANLLVSIHNVAAGEAIALGRKAGLHPAEMLDVLGDSAGASRMLAVRGPLMASRIYDRPTFSVANQMKDLGIIREFARATGMELPLFEAAARYYAEAQDTLGGGVDTAAVCEVAERRSLSRD